MGYIGWNLNHSCKGVGREEEGREVIRPVALGNVVDIPARNVVFRMYYVVCSIQ